MIQNIRTRVANALMAIDFEAIGARVDEFTTALAMRIHPEHELGWQALGFTSATDLDQFGAMVGQAIRDLDISTGRVRTPWDWANVRGDKILDPDGFDGVDFHLTLMTEEKYLEGLALCTVDHS